MQTPTFSVVIPTRSSPATLWLTLRAVRSTVPPETEIIVVPDLLGEGPDGATSGMLIGISGQNGPSGPVVQVLDSGVDRGAGGFPGCANAGLAAARGKYLVVLHDDTVPTSGWLDGLRATLLAAQAAIPDVRWGFVGPMTNFAMPRQLVSGPLLGRAQDANAREAVATALRTSAMDEFTPSGPLDSFCLLMTKQAYQQVGGFDEQFAPGGHEDIDLILRGQQAGFLALRAPRVFVYHSGRVTLREVGLGPFGDLPGQERLMAKHFPEERPTRTLTFLLRIQLQTEQDQERFVEQVRRLCELGEQLVIVDDRSTVSAMEPLKAAGLRDFVTAYRKNPEHLTPNAKRDRSLLLQMGRETGSDWLMGIEQDQWFDPKVTAQTFQTLMWPVDPTIAAYQYPVRTLWTTPRTLRVDEEWGRKQGASFFRNNDWGGMLELTHSPEDTLPSCVPFEQVSATAKLIVYDTRYLDLARARAMGLTFTEDPVLTTPLHSPKLTHLLMVKNEMAEMPRQACQARHWADHLLVVDTGSTDGLAEFCQRFDLPYVTYQCCDKWLDPEHMICDFSAARNFAVEQCEPGDCIGFLDADEEYTPQSYVLVPMLILEHADAFLVDINNHQIHPKTGEIQAYVTTQARLFRNHPLLRYEMPVHESLEYALKRYKDTLKLVKTDVVIEHHGYTREKPTERKFKGQNYAEKLIAIIEKDPTEARSYFALGQHYNSQQRYDEGDPLLGQALALDQDFLTARLELGLRLMKRSYDVFATTPNASVPTAEKRALIRKLLTAMQPFVGDLV